MKTRQTAETQARFGPLDWALSVGMALTWGSSFLLIGNPFPQFCRLFPGLLGFFPRTEAFEPV
jgi:hypothetical protein